MTGIMDYPTQTSSRSQPLIESNHYTQLRSQNQDYNNPSALSNYCEFFDMRECASTSTPAAPRHDGPDVSLLWGLVAVGFNSEGNEIPPHSHYCVIPRFSSDITLHYLLDQLADHPFTPRMEDILRVNSPWQIWTSREFVPVTSTSSPWTHLSALGARQLPMPATLYQPLVVAEQGTAAYEHVRRQAFGPHCSGRDLPPHTAQYAVYFLYSEVRAYHVHIALTLLMYLIEASSSSTSYVALPGGNGQRLCSS